MTNLRRRLYGVIVRLHPASFCEEFGREMMLDFEDALHSYGLGRLWRDVLWSLARQWSARILSNAPNPISAPRPSLLAGQYVMIREERLTMIELGRGLIVSVALLALCLFGLGGAPSRAPRAGVDLPIVYASSSTRATGRNANPNSPVPAGESSNSEFKLSQSAVSASAPLATASTTLPSDGSASALIRGLALAAVAQAQLSPELLLFHPSGPLPSYEVATIKPLDPNTADRVVKLPPGVSLNPLSIRRYIMDAYGAKYAAQIIGGPDWINKDSYVIHGKVPDDLEAVLQKKTSQDRIDQNRSMQQSLLADRFHLKAHFETRVLPVYELVPAKGGLKITEVPAPPERKPGDPPISHRDGDPLPPGTAMGSFNSNGLRILNARAIKMTALARIIGSDAGDRPIVDHTGFTGYFDIKDLIWAPLGDASADSADSAPDAPSLIGAMEKTLGIKLVPAKDPIEVLVIDHIEKPSEN
jgi:uncharacterized protein (TIGR03435 family)